MLLKPLNMVTDMIGKNGNLLCLWDFENGSLDAKGKYNYRLRSSVSTKTVFENEGPVSGTALKLEEGEYMYIKRSDCPALNIHGKKAEITVLAWVKRKIKTMMPFECEAVAGMWLESDKKRQYCLFLNLWIHNSANQVCGHISGIGGPTEGEKWCMDASIGKTPVAINEWEFVAFTYDGQYAKSYLNGELDLRAGRNPYYYPLGLFDGGENGADFTIGAVHRMGEMGNFFAGLLGGVAIFDRALNEAEIRNIYSA